MGLKPLWYSLTTAIGKFLEDRGFTMAAATAFFTALSLSPLVMILIGVAGLIGPEAQSELMGQLEGLAGPQAGQVLDILAASIHEQSSQGAMLSTIVGGLAVLIGATAVFGQVQKAMNEIWNAHGGEDRNMLWAWARKRLLGLGLIMGMAFLLLVSLAVTTALAWFIPTGASLWKVLDVVISLLVYATLFAATFKSLPDTRVQWREAFLGAGITAVLFAIGKYAIGRYLGYSSIGSAYGAAGSLVVLLVWVYYASLIFYFGAELTFVCARGGPDSTQ